MSVLHLYSSSAPTAPQGVLSSRAIVVTAYSGLSRRKSKDQTGGKAIRKGLIWAWGWGGEYVLHMSLDCMELN